MKKMSVTTIVALLLALMLSSTMAYAGFDWDGDPILSVGGTTVNVLIEAEEELNPSEVQVTVCVPKGVEVSVQDTAGFDLEIIKGGRAKHDRIPVEVTVHVPKARPDFDVRVTVVVSKYGISESEDGRTGRPIKVKVEIPIND
jgi:hypothetical protein